MGLAEELGVHRPGRTAFSRLIRQVAGSRPGSAVFSRTLRHVDRAALAVTGGRVTVSDGIAGVPTVFLTTTGAKSGEPRTTQLVAVPFGENLAVIGSNWGQQRHPGWVYNLLAHPEGTASYGKASVPVRARELSGQEADQVWTAGRQIYHGFENYPSMAGARTIRVFALEPLGR